jgi:DNA/RNA endonuclease YhcR with UshA esterase domain
MVRETIASETSILNDTNATQNSIENLTQSNATGTINPENVTETNQTGSISGRISSLMSPSLEGNCTVC